MNYRMLFMDIYASKQHETSMHCGIFINTHACYFVNDNFVSIVVCHCLTYVN